MATLDGVEVTECERCKAPTGAQKYTLTKDGGDPIQTVLCDACVGLTTQTEGFVLKPVGRTSARATQEDSGPVAAEPSSSRGKK